ncbi:MAG: restriction endonuclease [Candidatus Pacebacteria bacterium]|nr:restriction endonuclease [Candidatus Paceibacterota bacterium]
MKNNIKKFIKKAVIELIDNTTSVKKIKKLISTHTKKIHFVPIRYRIFGGLLQSMNIQFGNFIEKLLHIIVENEKGLKIVKDISGKRNLKLSITAKSESLIDEYITDCQNNNFNDNETLLNFNKLIDECLKNEKNYATKEINIRHDIDVLFKNKDNKFYYLEVKYDDNHDTGKYTDINRKFIKTYIGVANFIKIYDKMFFKPILYYLTQKKLKGNIYIPEKQFIYRGEKLFDEFFEIEYSALDKVMGNIGKDKDIIEIFDNLYNDIRINLELK